MVLVNLFPDNMEYLWIQYKVDRIDVDAILIPHDVLAG
jgi:hypothetical protein